MPEYRIAFIGSGSIARAHAFALSALPYYYKDIHSLKRIAVSSQKQESRSRFAKQYAFDEALDIRDLWRKEDIDTLFILSPNECHFAHLEKALSLKNIKRIYIEKPVCATAEEEAAIQQWMPKIPGDIKIQVGFQFLQMGVVRKALQLFKEMDFGPIIHFHGRYLHSGYLDPQYRKDRPSRLKPAPIGGAVADLGSHVFSLLNVFLGPDLEILTARQSGFFPDVPMNSDLCTTVLLCDGTTGAVGTVVASRISAGAGDLLELEITGSHGALRLSTQRPDVLEIFDRAHPQEWKTIDCGSDYLPVTAFPFQSAPAGWLRSLVHAHYLFFGGQDEKTFLPDLAHGLTVQRLLRETAGHLAANLPAAFKAK